MKKTFSLFLAFALGVVVPQTFAADYYVSPTGDDKAAGTSAETALKTIQAAIEKLEDNTPTTIHLEENATFDVYGPEAIIIGAKKKRGSSREKHDPEIGRPTILGRPCHHDRNQYRCNHIRTDFEKRLHTGRYSRWSHIL